MKFFMKTWQLLLLCILFFITGTPAQQINVARIEQMPNIPSPYLMRDWKQVAMGYDSLVFNFDLTGQYLPLGSINSSTENYPSHNSFKLHTVVGTVSPGSGEAINCLPAVIGASLVGIDKSNQNSTNWVLMCEEWFNNRPEQNIYKNHPVDDTYDDWWYVNMPNIFFFQLYDLYPSTGEFERQLKSVADQWLNAVRVMGGKSTPWEKPNMNFRGFDLRTMTPYSASPVEPESAGAIAWLLYNAYSETGNDEYRVGAEMAMEFLNELGSNPSYELQLPYGVYSAARMNAELGTEYNIEKMVNWCFNIGPLRNWGSILGTWGGLNVHGLIGESISNDYAFTMNTFEQVGALVPMVRYDDRFSRAIGKWVLNAANAARLFYPNYLPDHKQDSEEWAHIYDPKSYIAYEALRETGPNSASPFATGDAKDGGWGATNLCLYGSSHVGILGGIIETTDVTGILRLDLLKTDYFHTEAYPTFLYYNPFSEQKTVAVNLPAGTHDLYDAVANSFVAIGVSGAVNINIDGDSAVQLVVIPSGGNITQVLNKTYSNGVVIDFNSNNTVSNYPPRVKSLVPVENKILINDKTQIFCTAVDKEGTSISYDWTCSDGVITGAESVVEWQAPGQSGKYIIRVIIEDQNGLADTATVEINVVDTINNQPQINKIKASPRKIDLGAVSTIECLATDEDGDELEYNWSSDFGLLEGSGSSVTWTAPAEAGNYFIVCMVEDSKGGTTTDSVEVVVRDFSLQVKGNLVAYYPFNGNANDVNTHLIHGTNIGARLTADRFGNADCAFFFDGIDDYIKIPNNNFLNFTKMISVNFWMRIDEIYEREAYVLSHGSWDGRWKASITNQRMRWTLKTSSGIIDLDSETILETGKLYNVTLLYSGYDFEIYLNGELDAFTNWSGTIPATNIDLTIGQILPNNNEYNFKGVLDEIRIYDYALSVLEILELEDFYTSVQDNNDGAVPVLTRLYQNYPNPFNSQTKITFDLMEVSKVSLVIYDVLGRKIKTLVDGIKNPGKYSMLWDSKDNGGSKLASGIYFIRLIADKHISTKKIILLQ